MMQPTQGNRELIRHATAECSRLGIADVVSLAGLPAANRARLKSNEPQMILVAGAGWFHQANTLPILLGRFLVAVAFCQLGFAFASSGNRSIRLCRLRVGHFEDRRWLRRRGVRPCFVLIPLDVAHVSEMISPTFPI